MNVSGGTAAAASVSGGTTAPVTVSTDAEVATPTEDVSVLTLCVGCRRVVRLTDEQAVIAEAERIALDVVSLALCRRCIRAAASTG